MKFTKQFLHLGSSINEINLAKLEGVIGPSPKIWKIIAIESKIEILCRISCFPIPLYEI